MTFDIRELDAEGIPAAIDILVRCFGEDIREAATCDVQASFADYPYRPISLLASHDATPVGFIQTITAYFHLNTYSLLWLCVLPEMRGRGYGTRLLRAAEDFVIENRFQGAAGTFMLVCGYEQSYYENLGYTAGLKTHDDYPIMVRHVK